MVTGRSRESLTAAARKKARRARVSPSKKAELERYRRDAAHTRRLARLRAQPGFFAWRRWSHDFDSVFHELCKNPAIVTMTAAQVIALAEGIADAYKAMQDRRRPADIPEDY